jgi:hypothetical protein
MTEERIYNRQPAEHLTFRLSFSDWCCVVGGCGQPVAAEVYDFDYKAAVEAMGFRCPQGQPFRRSGSPRIFACAVHMDDVIVNATLSHPRWQTLLMPV